MYNSSEFGVQCYIYIYIYIYRKQTEHCKGFHASYIVFHLVTDLINELRRLNLSHKSCYMLMAMYECMCVCVCVCVCVREREREILITAIAASAVGGCFCNGVHITCT